MPEVIGTVEEVALQPKGGSKVILRTPGDQTRTVRFASNYEAIVPVVGNYGKCIYKDWKPDDWGDDKSPMKMVQGWEPMTASAVEGGTSIANGNGQASAPASNETAPVAPAKFQPSSTPRSAVDITATEILNQSKDLVTHLTSVGAIKSLDEAQSAWLALAEDGMEWHRQTTSTK